MDYHDYPPNQITQSNKTVFPIFLPVIIKCHGFPGKDNPGVVKAQTVLV